MMRAFWEDESGVVTVEAVLWMAFLVPLAVTIGQQVVGPLIANAQQQAALNADSLALISQALAVCAP